MKDDDSLPQKNVPHHDDRFIHRCQVRLCEDNQLYMLPSIYLINIRRLHIFFTHSLMLDSREKKRERRIVLLRLGFNDEERKEKCLLYHPVEEMKNLYLRKTRSQFGTSSLENIVASIESPFIRPSSTLRTKTTRRTI
jgi:hypothetical protein